MEKDPEGISTSTPGSSVRSWEPDRRDDPPLFVLLEETSVALQ